VHLLVSDLAGRLPRSVHRDDLVSAGMFGLVQAAGSWDPERGVAFESYARARIRGALIDELRQRDWATRAVRRQARKEQVAVDTLSARLGRQPSTAEVAEVLAVPAEDVVRLREDVARAEVGSLELLISGPATEPDVADSPADALLDLELRDVLAAAIDALPERLQHVVREYFFAERQMADIARDLGVTESRVSQMRAEAVTLLRGGIDSQLDPQRLPDPDSRPGRAARREAHYFAAVADRCTRSA
jgi:RNA polymerase sigma factor for flagellar operon FliA